MHISEPGELIENPLLGSPAYIKVYTGSLLIDYWEADASDTGGVIWVSGQNELVFFTGNGSALRYKERFLRCQTSCLRNAC